MSPRRRLYPTLGAPSCRLHARAKTRILLAPHDFHSLQFTMMPTCELAWRAPKQLGGRRLPSSNPGLVLISAKRTWADPTRSARGPLVANLAAFWQQISPIVPVLPTVPTHKSCAVYSLAFEAFHGMEEVIGSIPIRSQNTPNEATCHRSSAHTKRRGRGEHRNEPLLDCRRRPPNGARLKVGAPLIRILAVGSFRRNMTIAVAMPQVHERSWQST